MVLNIPTLAQTTILEDLHRHLWTVQNWKFTAPVFIDDSITAEATVINVHETKPVTQLEIKVTRQNGDTVLEGEAWCYTFSMADS